MTKSSKHKSKAIEINLIDPPAGQVRMEIPDEGIRELADSIRAMGMLQSILVRPVGERYEIVYGHRRWLACSLLDTKVIQAVVRDLTDLEVALMRATENDARLDLSPIEEAAVYADLRDKHGLSRQEIAKQMGKSSIVIQRRLDLLKMPPQLQIAIHKKEIGYTVAETLWSLGDIEAIEYYLAFAVEHGATRAVVVQWVKDWKDRKRREESPGEGGVSLENPSERRPVWVTCDICGGPAEVQTVSYLHACPGCMESIKKALAGLPANAEGG